MDIEIPEHIDGKSLVPLLTGDDENFRGYIHIEHAPRFHGIVTETDKFIWYVASGREQYFDLVNDPDELHNAINDREYKQRVDYLRDVLIDCLKDRLEEFVENGSLIPGKEYNHLIPV